MAYQVWLVDQPGGAFKQSDRATPTLDRNQVLVRIAASAVASSYGLLASLPGEKLFRI